jgi:hypothetical protein
MLTPQLLNEIEKALWNSTSQPELRWAIRALCQVARAAKLFRSNSPDFVLECARQDWGNTNVNCAKDTGAQLDSALDGLQSGSAGLFGDR